MITREVHSPEREELERLRDRGDPLMSRDDVISEWRFRGRFIVVSKFALVAILLAWALERVW